jgi:hypothetical protein
VLMRVFDSRGGFFHTVFNKSVENCHRPFTISSLVEITLARELLVTANPHAPLLHNSPCASC